MNKVSTALALCSLFVWTTTTTTIVQAQLPWTVNSNGDLLYNNQQVQLKGFAVTCTEYLLRGIGTRCLASYNWNDPANIITSLNTAELDAMYSHLLPAPSGVIPSLRVCLTAGYWLDVETPAWKSNRDRYPGLAAQYRTLIDKFVTDATSRGIVVILDLHWNNDVQEMQPMAQKGASAGDSLTFWRQLAQRYKSNPLVFYELYNEPHASSFNQWFLGDSQYEGMRPMAEAVANEGVQGMILVGGAYDYAYDAQTLVDFNSQISPLVLSKVAYVVHPYMGPYQAGDPKKNADGFVALLNTLSVTKRPVLATELGQYCCAANGACYAYNGVFQGQPMGYVQAVLTELERRSFHWNAWGWRPNTAGGGNCNSPDANDGYELYDSAKHNGQGADYDTLFPMFYKKTTSGPPTVPVTKVPTTKSPTTQPPSSKSPTSRSPTVATTTKSPTNRVTNGPTAKVTTKNPTTTTPPTTTTKSPTTPVVTSKPTTATWTNSPTLNNGGACAARWTQCAGRNFAERACCDDADECVFDNEWYSQCRPKSTSAPTHGIPDGTCAQRWAQCGGIGYSGPTTCCEPDSTCVVGNPYYSQCIPAGRRRLLRV